MNIAFAWGWTGWHVFPIKSLIEYIRKNNLDFKKIIWLWEKDSLEEKISNQLNVDFFPIVSWKLRREKSFWAIIKNIRDWHLFFQWIFQAKKILKQNKIDIVFCKGWYVALPVVIAAKILKIKIFVHETDSIAWLTNKIWAKFAQKNFVAFENTLKNSIKSGPIISDEFLDPKKIDFVKADFSKTCVLVTAWSQGSKTIFSALESLINNSSQFDNINFFFTLWTQNLEFKKNFTKPNCHCYDFLSQKDMASLINMCDIAITRWGWSCFELKAFGLKLAIVPLPYTGWNHQFFNAQYFEKNFWDQIFDQNKNLEKDLENFLAKKIGYKKNPQDSNIEDFITKPKKIIFDTILAHTKNY